VEYFLDYSHRIYRDVSLTWRCGASDGCSKNWKAVGTGDFNRDGFGDLLWWNATTGEVSAWLLNGMGVVLQAQNFSKRCGTADGCSKNSQIIAIGDIDGDGIDDVFWQSLPSGAIDVWVMNASGTVVRNQRLGRTCGTSNGCSQVWKAVGLGDFNQDGVGDLLWKNSTTGELSAWLLNRSSGYVNGPITLTQRCVSTDGCAQNFRLAGTGDFNGDRFTDLLWHDTHFGSLLTWQMGTVGRVMETGIIPFNCGALNGCSLNSRAVGVLRDYHITP
jgi:hypothetical protein